MNDAETAPTEQASTTPETPSRRAARSRIRAAAGRVLPPMIAQRALNTPLMATPSLVAAILQASADNGIAPQAMREVEDVEIEPEPIGPHIVHIVVEGVLVQDANSWQHACMGVTGYHEIQAAIEMARSCGALGAVLDIRSGGGEVAGCFDFVDWLYALRADFPVYGVANDGAYSAAYAILSACQKRAVTRTGGVGSVGVIARWQSTSVMDADVGQVREVVSRRLKNSLSPHQEDLPPEGLATLQDMVNRADALFVSTVARNIGVSPEAIGALEAGERFGEDAVASGLVHVVANVEQLTAMLLEDLKVAAQSALPSEGDTAMPVTKSATPIQVAETITPKAADAPPPVEPPADALPKQDDPKDDPAPLFKVGDPVTINAPYSTHNGQVGKVSGEPVMQWVYAVKIDGAEGDDSYCETELSKPMEAPMDAQMAARETALNAQLATAAKAEADAKTEAAAAKAKADALDAKLMDRALMDAGVKADVVPQYRLMVQASRTEGQDADDAVASHKAAFPGLYQSAEVKPTEAVKTGAITQTEMQPDTLAMPAANTSVPATLRSGGPRDAARVQRR